jgi:hypothetical protein
VHLKRRKRYNNPKGKVNSILTVFGFSRVETMCISGAAATTGKPKARTNVYHPKRFKVWPWMHRSAHRKKLRQSSERRLLFSSKPTMMIVVFFLAFGCQFVRLPKTLLLVVVIIRGVLSGPNGNGLHSTTLQVIHILDDIVTIMVLVVPVHPIWGLVLCVDDIMAVLIDKRNGGHGVRMVTADGIILVVLVVVGQHIPIIIIVARLQL